MKSLTLIGLAMLAFAFGVKAQKIKLIEGDLSALKGQTTLNTQFIYDNLMVGKHQTEADYVHDKTSELNGKNPGKGDTWAKEWVTDRHDKYEPRFNDLFFRESGLNYDAKAKYTLIVKTSWLEPGYNVGISSHPADINGEAWLVETGNPGHVLAKLSFTKAPGRMFGADFDTGIRITECYATAGKGLGRFVKKS
jgi:hypothetical protein